MECISFTKLEFDHKYGTEAHTHIYGFHHLFSGILSDNFLDKWEGKISEVSASIVPTLMHVLFNTISKLISVLPISYAINRSILIHINVNE